MDINLLNRRLLLAKEFYLQAKENSRKVDSVSKMMAIHNFHIAIEITLKAIILKYGIRTDKQLNIDFESMMSEISNKITDKKIPFRQELRSLNSLRGLIQHQGIEPDITSLEDFEIITRKFLHESFIEYFNVDFNNLSRIDLISDILVKDLAKGALKALEEKDFLKSAVILEGGFQLLTVSITHSLLKTKFNTPFFVTSDLSNLNLPKELREVYTPIKKAIEKIYERIQLSDSFSALLGSGINLADLKRFQNKPFVLDFSISGNPIVQTTQDINLTENYSYWSLDFFTSTVLLWQKNGLNPNIDINHSDAVKNLLSFDATY